VTGMTQRLSTFIMAGGRGERLWPLTENRAKPAVPFGGIFRIIDFTLSNCIHSGIRRIHVLTQYESKSVADHIRKGWNKFHADFNEYLDVRPSRYGSREDGYRGTADSVYQNLHTIEQENPDFVLVLAADHVYKMDYSRMLDFHIRQGADLTIGVVERQTADSRYFGVLEVADGQEVKGFQEKPQHPVTIPGKHDRIHASMGIYIFRARVLFEELHRDATRQSEHDFGRNILPAMVENRRLCAYELPPTPPRQQAYWRDIGTVDAYYEANMDLLSPAPRFDLCDREWPIRTHPPQSPPASILPWNGSRDAARAESLDSIVSGGCVVIGARLIRSVLSPGVRVLPHSLVENSVLMEGVRVGHHARIRNAILDKDVDIPPGTCIGFDLEQDRERFTVTPSGVVVVAKETAQQPESDGYLRSRLASRHDAFLRRLPEVSGCQVYASTA
jgi:glucose-1-phosphate adenylyltransferase